MPDNNPLGGRTAQDMFERQSGDTSPGKEAGGAIKPPVASVKSEGTTSHYPSSSYVSANKRYSEFYYGEASIRTYIGKTDENGYRTDRSYFFSPSGYIKTTTTTAPDGSQFVTSEILNSQTKVKTYVEAYYNNKGEVVPSIPELEPIHTGEVEITERQATVKTIDRESQRLPPELLPTFREAVAAIRAAAGKSDPKVTNPGQDDGSGGSGSVDPGKMGGGWIKKPVPDGTGPPPIVSPGSNVDTERVRPRVGDPLPIDPEPDYGQQQPSNPDR